MAATATHRAIAPAALRRSGSSLLALQSSSSARAAARLTLALTAPSLLAPSPSPRGFVTSTRPGASNNAMLGFGSPGGGHGSGIPPSYFQKPSLPANTIIRFVPQQTAWIVERMGKFHRILQPGLAILIPFLDRIAYVRNLKEVAFEIPSQSAITADNVTLELDGVLYTRVFDAYKAR